MHRGAAHSRAGVPSRFMLVAQDATCHRQFVPMSLRPVVQTAARIGAMTLSSSLLGALITRLLCCERASHDIPESSGGSAPLGPMAVRHGGCSDARGDAGIGAGPLRPGA